MTPEWQWFSCPPTEQSPQAQQVTASTNEATDAQRSLSLVRSVRLAETSFIKMFLLDHMAVLGRWTGEETPECCEQTCFSSGNSIANNMLGFSELWRFKQKFGLGLPFATKYCFEFQKFENNVLLYFEFFCSFVYFFDLSSRADILVWGLFF